MLDAYRDLIDELLAAPASIRALVGSAPAAPEVLIGIATLRDRDLLVTQRLRSMLKEPPGMISALPENQSAPVIVDGDDVLAGFDTARGDLVSLLMNLTLKQWERVAPHDTEGEITMSTEIERHVDFDERLHDQIRNAVG